MKKIRSHIGSMFLRNCKLGVGLGIAACLVIGTTIVPLVQADQYDEQIKTLRNQNSDAQGSVSQLQVQANSYQDAINKLSAQITAINAAIADSQARQASLQQQIDADQAKLDSQKKMLGEDLKSMYVNGQMSTVEMLATSKNLSDFVDAETYRNAVQVKIQATLKEVTALQNQLKQQKQQIEALLTDQKSQQSQLDSDQAQQNQLLAMNQSQQDGYNSQIKNNNAQISSLRQQQMAANAALFAGAHVVVGSACDSSHGDTYPTPWCNSAQDSLVDNWGMFNRECVSYTAWKVFESGRHMPYWGGTGNANQWDDNARAAGIPVDGTPRAGDVAIKNSMPYGHAMYVESVNANGTLNISQYNASLDGTYSRVYNMSPGGLVFIHF